ncbi:hypothetical protein HOT81_gp083 [Gordonia phage Fryberger]|uniref:Uncharacterized protein n=1 Tax=Gordonia phage Fryberger TaxID=2250392 RepID=A0A346FCN6_9CAUD|nr:hypothetical protein HOT81_gp083 [Gordonia phage Fryberger]AXN53500.1 hypothetical protein SEA_FRYBERGER_83 [Gordonia phage Fryberger]
MGVTKKEVWEYRCDRCHHTSDKELSRSGCANVSVTYTVVGMNHDVGGWTEKGLFLCGYCSQMLNSFMHGGELKGEELNG